MPPAIQWGTKRGSKASSVSEQDASRRRVVSLESGLRLWPLGAQGFRACAKRASTLSGRALTPFLLFLRLDAACVSLVPT